MIDTSEYNLQFIKNCRVVIVGVIAVVFLLISAVWAHAMYQEDQKTIRERTEICPRCRKPYLPHVIVEQKTGVGHVLHTVTIRAEPALSYRLALLQVKDNGDVVVIGGPK